MTLDPEGRLNVTEESQQGTEQPDATDADTTDATEAGSLVPSGHLPVPVEPLLTLAEIAPGVDIAFGDVPEGLELVEFGMITQEERDRFSLVLEGVGGASTVAGAEMDRVGQGATGVITR